MHPNVSNHPRVVRARIAAEASSAHTPARRRGLVWFQSAAQRAEAPRFSEYVKSYDFIIRRSGPVLAGWEGDDTRAAAAAASLRGLRVTIYQFPSAHRRGFRSVFPSYDSCFSSPSANAAKRTRTHAAQRSAATSLHSAHILWPDACPEAVGDRYAPDPFRAPLRGPPRQRILEANRSTTLPESSVAAHGPPTATCTYKRTEEQNRAERTKESNGQGQAKLLRGRSAAGAAS